MDKVSKTLNLLESRGRFLDPEFKITEQLIEEYQVSYGIGKQSKGNKQLNKKLATLNLLKRKNLKLPANKIPEGWVYVISNPAWEAVKIGKSINVKERLKEMQTYCPIRGFKVEHYIYSVRALEVERQVHKNLEKYRLKGEWFAVSAEEARKEIKRVCDVIG